MKAKEIREMPLGELHAKLQELRERLVALRIKKRVGGLESPALVRTTRRDIARILTILRERQEIVR
ncbi:MAG: 50S ribosomal protein L29 [Candidatus Binatia bacterium]|nr:MAG: 50S ribosomal protein L29 [Candidatus Binatia bacterium]